MSASKDFDIAHVIPYVGISIAQRSERRASASGLDLNGAKEVGAATGQPSSTSETTRLQCRAIVLEEIYNAVAQLWRKLRVFVR